MADSAFDHPSPWTESEYFALGPTTSRVELFDGCLWVGPGINKVHHEIADRLVVAMDRSARALGLRAHSALTLRLGSHRVAAPDLIVDDGDWGASFTWASEAILVGEVLSANTSLADRVLKRRLYAEAGVPWYLLVEPHLPGYHGITLQLLRLASGEYVEHTVTENGTTLTSTDPFRFELATADLLGAQDQLQ
jgi:Uma2 family endonuclease